MLECAICSKDSHGHKYCVECSVIRSDACSLIKQNSKKLQKLFATKWYTPEWFEKFERYVTNIQKQEAVLMKFLEKDARRRFGIK